MAEENGVGERVSVQPDKNVAKKYDVFVTERVFDDCYNLFSPCVFRVGRLARSRSALVLPCLAEVWAMPVEATLPEVGGVDLRALDARRVDAASGFASRCKRRPLGEGVSFTVDFGADETKEMWVTLKMPLATAGRWNAVQVWADVWFDTENWVSFRPRALEGPGTGLAKCGDQLGTLLYYAAGEHKVTRKNVVTARFCLCPRDGALRLIETYVSDVATPSRPYGGHGASFPGWHLPMLECERRNKAFVEAVQRVVRRRKEKDCVVLDVGAGTGVLALVAKKANPRATVVAVEADGDMADVARATLATNGDAAHEVKLVHAHSAACLVGTQIPKKADVVIAEVFDSGLLGEKCLETLSDVGRRLANKGADFIPRAATLWLLLLDAVPRASTGFSLDGLDKIPRFALTRDATPLNVDLCKARSLATHKRLHPPVRVFDFDFANVGELTRTKDHALSFTEEGCCNGFALYFDLDLDGETLSTAPDGPPTCWFQSLRYFREPINVKPGTTATLRAAHAASSVAAEVVDVVPPIPEGLSADAPDGADADAIPPPPGESPLGEPK